MKWIRQCPLLLLILLSGILAAGLGYAGKDSIYADYRREEKTLTTGIASVFQGWKDGIYPWYLWYDDIALTMVTAEKEDGFGENSAWVEELLDKANMNSEAGMPDDGMAEENHNGGQDSDPDGTADGEMENTENEEAQNGNDSADPGIPSGIANPPQYDKFGVLISGEEALPFEQLGQEDGQAESPEEKADEPLEEISLEPLTYELGPVDEDYFKDALFIGDSRTVGLQSYVDFPEETDFICANSVTIHQLVEKPKKIAQLQDGRKGTVEEALQEKQYGKIYINLGINEIGRGTKESFFTSYAETVNQIRLLQPEAKIFIQAIMRVTTEKSENDPVYNNERINERNEFLSLMADDRNIFYLEINDAVCDETGGVIEEYTYDQVHLKAKYYQLWKDYLLAHGIQ